MTTININLLPEELRESGGGSRGGASMPSVDRAAMVPIGIGLAIAVVLGAIPYGVQSFYLDNRQKEAQEAEDQVKDEISKYTVTLNQLKGIADNKEYLRAQLSTLQTVAGVGTSWGDILNEMRSQTPANLWFDSMRSDPGKGVISIEGGALDYGSVAYLHRNLDHSDYFYEPTLTSTELQKNSQSGVNVVKFTMNVKVRLTKVKT